MVPSLMKNSFQSLDIVLAILCCLGKSSFKARPSQLNGMTLKGIAPTYIFLSTETF